MRAHNGFECKRSVQTLVRPRRRRRQNAGIINSFFLTPYGRSDPMSVEYKEVVAEILDHVYKNMFEAHRGAMQSGVAGVYAVFGPRGLTLFVAQAVAVTLGLHVVNYFQHWGLERRPGQTVPASWASWVSGAFSSTQLSSFDR